MTLLDIVVVIVGIVVVRGVEETEWTSLQRMPKEYFPFSNYFSRHVIVCCHCRCSIVYYQTVHLFTVENITYMCAKLNVENGTAVSSGCFREERDARVIEVCVCQSAVGGKPCNSSSTLVSNTIAMIMTAALTWILWRWS